MRYYLLLSLVILGGFAFAAIAGSLAVRLTAGRLYARSEALGPHLRARIFFLLRTLPLTAGLSLALLLAASFLRHEPRQTSETPGILLILSAVSGIALAIALAVRAVRLGVRAVWFTRLLKHCRQSTVGDMPAWVIDTRYPVAAVLGVFRPRLLVSSRILRECTNDEIAAIVAHERAHIRHNHNLVRAAMVALPDPLGRFGAGARLERAWGLAAEQAADGESAGASEQRRAVLADALIRVARMAQGVPPDWMPALAFYQGHDLQLRVQALLERPASRASSSRTVPLVAILGAAAFFAWLNVNSDALHRGLEWMVRTLP